jgi:hypothetical protein
MQAGTIEVKFHGRQSKASGHPYFPGFQPGKEVLRKGSITREGALALPCDILKERDTAVKLRDGTNIYVDVLRPAGVSSKHPTIISWTPFGKNGLTVLKSSTMPPGAAVFHSEVSVRWRLLRPLTLRIGAIMGESLGTIIDFVAQRRTN